MRQYFNRVIYNRVTARWMKEIGSDTMDAVEISGRRCKRWGFRNHTSFDFPEYDICGDPFRGDDGAVIQADIILAEQVWEHLDAPYRATQNVYRMLKPGGYFWLAAPFFVRAHGVPVDCSRWSARGLTNLLVECGFDRGEIRAEQWGNRQCVEADLEPSWGIYDPELHSLKNEPRFPVMSWALARKETG